MDNERTPHSLRALHSVHVRVPVMCAFWPSSKSVCEIFSGSNASLCNTNCSICPRCLKWVDTVPMYGDCFRDHMISHVNRHGIVQIHFNRGTRVLAIDQDRTLAIVVRNVKWGNALSRFFDARLRWSHEVY